MTTRRKTTKKRFAPVAVAFPFSSDISGLLSDSDEDTTQKQEQDVAGPRKLVLEDRTVGRLGSITQPHDRNNIFTSGNSLPSAAVSSLSEQKLKLDEPKNTRGSKVKKRKELKIDQTKMKMAVLFSADKDELVDSQRMRSSTSQMNEHAGPAKNVLQSSADSMHIVTDSEEELIETQSNNNARAQRTGTEKGLLPAKNGQQSAVNSNDTQVNSLTSVHQHVATSTPLRKTTTPLTFISSLPSPVTPAMSPSAVKTRGRVSQVAKSEKMIVSAQKDLNDASVVPGIHKEIEEEDNDHSKRRRTSSRKIRTADNHEAGGDEDCLTVFSTEKHFDVKSGCLEHLDGGSSSRIVSAQNNSNDAAVVPGIHKEIEEEDNDRPKRRRTFSRKLYTPKDDDDDAAEKFHQEGAVIFSAEQDSELKCGLSANVRGRSSNRFKRTTMSKSRHYSRKSSGVEENAQNKADNKNNVKSFKNKESVNLNKRATMSQQEEETSDMERNEIRDLRRSIRQRVKPLEYWRGERIKYKIGADRCREVAGIDPGFPSRQRVHRKHHGFYAKKILQCVEENSKEPDSRKLVSVPHGNGMRELECFSTFRIDSDVAKFMEGNYDVYTALKVSGMSAGYVEIGPVCESCSVIDSNLVFCIVVGELTVTIHETALKVRKGEIFFVPKGVSHLLRNDGEEKSILAFTKYD